MGNNVSAWDSYRTKGKRSRVRYTLDDFDLPNLWFDVRNPAMMTPSETADMDTLDTQTPLGKRKQNLLFPSDIAYIVDWNFTDPDTGEPLAPPSKDPDSCVKVPIEVLMHMKACILEAFENIIPKKVRERLSGLQSGQSKGGPKEMPEEESEEEALVERWKRESASQTGSVKSS